MGELLGESAELLGGCSSGHRGVVVAELGEHLDEVLLNRRSGLGVSRGVHGGGGGAGGEPLAGRETAEEGDVVLVDLLLAQHGADLVRRLGSLVADKGLLDTGKVLEDGEDEVGVLGTAKVLDEVAPKLLRQREEDLVVIVEGLLEEGEELCTSAVGTEGEADGGDAVEGVEAKGDVLCAKFINWTRRGTS